MRFTELMQEQAGFVMIVRKNQSWKGKENLKNILKGGLKKMGLKEWTQKQIEKGAVKSVIDGETVILKKSRVPIIGGEWKQIYPPIDENGKVNLLNLVFGGWRNALALGILAIIITMALMHYFEVLNIISYIRENCVCPTATIG